jgi:hypothetical protein
LEGFLNTDALLLIADRGNKQKDTNYSEVIS